MQNWTWLIQQLTESILMYVNMNCQVAVCHSKLYTQTNLKERKKETRILDLSGFYNFKIFTNVQ